MTTTSTTIDWLRVRAQASPGEALGALRGMFGTLGPTLTLGEHSRGLLGFRSAIHVMAGDMPVARMDFGGESQRGWLRLDMSGQACAWVKDWDAAEELEALPQAEIRRLDIALTTWEGEITHDHVVQAHGRGEFTTRGRPPEMRQILSSDDDAGRTCYVGTRAKSPKFFRAYEKGKELRSKMAAGLPGRMTHIDGFRVEDIYRCELELKAEGADIPWDVIDRRDQYFTGAYPFCSRVLPGVEPDILQRRPEKAPQRELQAALAHLRHQFGNTLFTALTAYHGDMGAVWEKVVGREHNRHLLEAGVLLVEHD